MKTYETFEDLPTDAQEIIRNHQETDNDWEDAERCAAELRKAGYTVTAEYGEIVEISR